MNYQRFKLFLDKLVLAERSPSRLALSSCVGIFIACSPLLGIQTIVALAASIILNLNTTVIMLVLYLINNPFTMIPIVVANYTVGKLLFDSYVPIDFAPFTPSWMHHLDTYMTHKVTLLIPHASFTLWHYLLGGIIFALACSIPLYPLLYHFFTRIVSRYPQDSQHPTPGKGI